MGPGIIGSVDVQEMIGFPIFSADPLAQELHTCFPPAHFDVVHIRNALDHSCSLHQPRMAAFGKSHVAHVYMV